MKRIPAVLMVAIGLLLSLASPVQAVLIYHTVDQMLGTGPMSLDLLSASYNSGTNTWALDLSATNTGSAPLSDVNLTLQYLFPIDSSGAPTAPAFNYIGADTWSDGTNTLQYTGTNMGPLSSLLTAQVSDYSNISSVTFGPYTKNWNATDPLPIIPLGNFTPSQVDNFTLNASVSSRYLFRTFGYFVAVPEPSTIVLFALGMIGLLLVGRRARSLNPKSQI